MSLEEYQLVIKEHKLNDFRYLFLLTLEDIRSLAYMPYKLVGSGHPGTESHIRLNGPVIAAYRLGEEFYIMYNNCQRRS